MWVRQVERLDLSLRRTPFGPFAMMTTAYSVIHLLICVSFDVLGRGLKSRPLSVATVMMGVFGIPVFIFALRTKISPLFLWFLRAPFHHCVFCVWQDLWYGEILSCGIIVGLWLAIAHSWIYLVAWGKKWMRQPVAASRI